MKQLYLLRHAHTVPHGLSLSDFDRPLDEQGQEESQLLAQYLQKNNVKFDFVLCSAALRAQETLEPLRQVVGTKSIEISENFYNIPEDAILSHLQHLSDDINKVLYIGHNPGIAFSILQFTNVLPPFLMEGVTPGTLAGLQLSIDHWVDLDWGKGEVTDVFQPNQDSTKSPAPQES